MYGPEEMVFDEEEKEESSVIEIGDDELAFDEVSEENKSEYGTETPRDSDKLIDTSDGSNKSQDVITESMDSSNNSS